jgi:Apea-like HEPN
VGGASYPSALYRANFNVPVAEQFDGRKAATLTNRFFALPKTTREIVTRAMERLDKAMCDPLPGDAAIDLSIALEVLTTDPGGQGEHTWKVGLRSALLLGGNLENREKTRRTVKEIYDYRSKVVHTGHIPANRVATATTAVSDSILVCAQIIESVRRGRLPPDWSKFELSGGTSY